MLCQQHGTKGNQGLFLVFSISIWYYFSYCRVLYIFEHTTPKTKILKFNFRRLRKSHFVFGVTVRLSLCVRSPDSDTPKKLWCAFNPDWLKMIIPRLHSSWLIDGWYYLSFSTHVENLDTQIYLGLRTCLDSWESGSKIIQLKVVESFSEVESGWRYIQLRPICFTSFFLHNQP